jgi:two-component system phosphate regulon sensor histidine kinase PhoR
MKYKRFRMLFAAMSLALAGVVCLQIFWLSNAIDLEKKKFSEQVREAMVKASEKIESREAFTLLSDAFGMDDALLPEKANDSIVICSSNKTVQIINSTNYIPQPPKAPQSPGSVPPPPPTPPVFLRNDSIVIKNDSGMMLVMRKEQRLKSAVKGMYMKYVMKGGKAEDRVTKKQINDVLKESFTNAGITENFSFVVKDNSSGNFEFVSDSLQLKNFASAEFKTKLFPGDLQSEQEDLLVKLDGHHNRIISNLWPQFLLSFLFTIFLIVVFFMTFREALKQKKLSEIKNNFINNMTHEFKTPIATISLAADTVMNEKILNNPERVRQYAEVIKRENRRMNEQVEKVLELALTERNELQIVKETIDLHELLSRIVHAMALQVDAKKGKIAADFTDCTDSMGGERRCEIRGDAFHLERVFMNLLDNAIKYSKNAPQIGVKTFSINDTVVIEISDNGIGISEDEQKRIFDRFYRVSTGNVHDVKGFGLGLNYVKTIVEKHGGKISVTSKPGKGSIFRIILNYK